MKKLQTSITVEHPDAMKTVIPEELELEFSEEVQKEADKNNEKKVGPIEGEISHNMRWHQENRQVSLVGFGWNFCKNLNRNPRFTKLNILMSEFEDNTQLSSAIKFKKHVFKSTLKDLIWIDEVRKILHKDLHFINELEHKERVQTKLEERKTVKIKEDKKNQRFENELPPLPAVARPLAESKAEIQERILVAELEVPMKFETEHYSEYHESDYSTNNQGGEKKEIHLQELTSNWI